jgi:hypothetical protein
MPHRKAHIDQARSNALFLSTLDPRTTQHPDWAITIAFYTAVHLVDACLDGHSIHPNSHTERRDAVAMHLGLIRAHYVALYSESRRTRYLCQNVTNVQAQLQLQGHYVPVRDDLCSDLGILPL